MKKQYFFLLLIFFSFPFSGKSKVWTISDSNLKVQFNDQTSVLTVTDLRCKKVWEQAPFNDSLTIAKISQKDNVLNLSLAGKYKFDVTIILSTESDLIFTLSADAKGALKELTFPRAFNVPDKNHYMLMTESEGYLLPVTDPDFKTGRNNMYTMSDGLSMSWLGMTDTDFKTGYMIILDTPDDAAIQIIRKDGLLTFEPVWISSLGNFGYSRKAIYHFFDKGGYVAQCKKYREYIWKRNNIVSLRDNTKKIPSIDKMIGAVHIYVWDQARQVSFAKDLKQSGIDKAFILWDPNHNPYPEAGYDSRLKELGYASGVYELFTGLRPRDSVPRTKFDTTEPVYLRRSNFPGLCPAASLVRKDGRRGGICPEGLLPFLPGVRVDKELSIYPHESYFIDVWSSNVLNECYDKNHPLTRTQFRQAAINIYKLFTEKYKLFCGGEWGADWVGSESVYSHGMMTLHRTWEHSSAYQRGTIYYIGNWSDARPSIVISTSTANDLYWKYSISEYIRVPLYELVYHDSMVSTWRWEDGNNKLPELWWKKDLFNILYGTPPLWSMDQELWKNYKTTFVESYKNVCPWIQKVGYDEMVSHRFINADRTVQESVFSSGQRAIVNFSFNPFTFEGKLIKGQSYIILPN